MFVELFLLKEQQIQTECRWQFVLVTIKKPKIIFVIERIQAESASLLNWIQRKIRKKEKKLNTKEECKGNEKVI